MKQSIKCALTSLALLASASFCSTVAHATEDAVMNHHADVSPMCGTKPMVFGLSDGYGGDTWRKTAVAELKDELSRCKNVKRFIYSNANGDQQKANADVNSMVAQGVNVLIMLPDFGAAQVPSMRAATKAGVSVVPYLAQVPGVAGRDYVANVVQDTRQVGIMWADWFGANVKTGTVAFMGGSAGSTSSQNFMDGFKAGLKKYPNLKLLSEDFVVTNWNPVDAQKAAAGLIAQYGHVDAIATDFGVTALAAIKAFELAHLPVPAIATIASNNELNCRYQSAKSSGSGAFRYYSVDGSTSTVRFAARRAIAAYQGTSDPESLSILPFPYADSAKGLNPKCDQAAPPDADLSSALPTEKLKAVFQQ